MQRDVSGQRKLYLAARYSNDGPVAFLEIPWPGRLESNNTGLFP